MMACYLDFIAMYWDDCVPTCKKKEKHGYLVATLLIRNITRVRDVQVCFTVFTLDQAELIDV